MSLLTMTDITKVFPGVVANDGISFSLERGEIHALVGENGAGKTTLMKILYGMYRPDGGEILVNDVRIDIRNSGDAIGSGIGMVHQHFMLIPPFTVLENIVLGSETQRLGVLKLDGPETRVRELMKANGIELDLNARVEDLSVGSQQQVEILKILYRGANILVFDEPTAVLTPQESIELFQTFRMLKEQGKGIIFISHKLDEVLSISDRITVIRRGRVIRTLPGKEADKAIIAELMVGKPVLLQVRRTTVNPGETVLDADKVSLIAANGVKVLDDVSFSIRCGEIYGIAGVEGNGQSELVRILAGTLTPAASDIRLGGRSMAAWDVRKRKEAGLAHIPEDRQRFGLVLPFSIAENLSFGMHHRPPFVSSLRIMNMKVIRENARKLIKEYDIRTPSETIPVLALSGGNQQKVIIAREMSSDPILLLASQPTRGVDIGATEFIYNRLIDAKAAGKAVLLVSADLDEIMSLSDRIGVMYKGRIIREFKRDETTKEEVGFFMMGERSK